MERSVTGRAGQGSKRRKTEVDSDQRQQLLAKAMCVLDKPEDEYDHIGKVIAAKLRKMEEHQFLYADKLINDVLYKGLQRLLSANTTLHDNVYDYTHPQPPPFQQPPPFHHYQGLGNHLSPSYVNFDSPDSGTTGSSRSATPHETST